MRKKDDTPAALDHILYEMEMLTHSLLLLCGSDVPCGRDGSGWLEVFAVHARNLNEFFAKENERGCYMKPHHFVQWTYSYVFDTKLARRASGQIAHLTYDRERPEEKTPWPFELHFKTLREPSLVFLRAVILNEPMMAYHANRARAEALLEVMRRIQFKDDPIIREEMPDHSPKPKPADAPTPAEQKIAPTSDGVHL